MAFSMGLGRLPRRRGSALAHGCDRCGRVVLPLARAAAVSTGLRAGLGLGLGLGSGLGLGLVLGLGLGLKLPEAEEADAQEVEDGKAEDERVQEGRVLVDEPGEAQAWAWRTAWARLGVRL